MSGTFTSGSSTLGFSTVIGRKRCSGQIVEDVYNSLLNNVVACYDLDATSKLQKHSAGWSLRHMHGARQCIYGGAASAHNQLDGARPGLIYCREVSAYSKIIVRRAGILHLCEGVCQ